MLSPVALRPLEPLTCRCLHTTSVLCKNKAARVQRSKGDKPVTYEEFWAPHYIGVRKGFNAVNTSNVHGFTHNASQVTVEDFMIRKIIHGTFLNMLLMDHIIIKRRHNQIFIVLLLKGANQNIIKYYFLKGYAQKLLQYITKQIVSIEITCYPEHEKIYKYI